MPSPFPGMDPYIEDSFFWPDFHLAMLGCMREFLNAVLPRQYLASIERHAWVEEQGGEQMALPGPLDVQVTDRASADQTATGNVTTVAVAAPGTIVLPFTRNHGSRFLRIFDRQRRRVVTVIHVLCPDNKEAGGYGIAYRAKRADYLASEINLVEIDLLRAGQRPPLQVPPPPPSDYYILVCPIASFPQAGFWPLSVRDVLPAVPVPLTQGRRA